MADGARLFAKAVSSPRKKGTGFVARFKTSLATVANSFVIDFDFRRNGRLPHRMNVIIGYSRTGKTLLVSNLAIIASGFRRAAQERGNAYRSKALLEILLPLLADASFLRIGLAELYSDGEDQGDQAPIRLFLDLSSGHKAALK